MNTDIIAALTTVAFLAGFFDAIAGGGGLITLPALLLTGMDPVSAIATNKFQAAAATVSATATYAKKGLIEWSEGKFLIPFGIAGGVGGALLTGAIQKRWFEAAAPVMLMLVAAYFALAPKISSEPKRAKISVLLFSATIAPLLGFYDGLFGPGVGSFFMIALVVLCGLETMRAVGFTKLGNASCNIGSLAVFIAKGSILWPAAVAMALASFAGAQLGARCAVRIGPKIVKPMIIVVCCALAVKLISIPSNPIRVALSNLF